MENTSGFYRMMDDCIQYAPTFVYAPTYELIKEKKDSYIYPIDGWYWFDSEEQASLSLNMK